MAPSSIKSIGIRGFVRLPLWAALLLCALLTAALTWGLTRQVGAPQRLTQDDINAAVLHTLNTQDLPSRAARAAQLIAPSVVHVRTQDEDKKNPQGELQDSGVGELAVGAAQVASTWWVRGRERETRRRLAGHVRHRS